MTNAALILADGTRFEGACFGAAGEAVGQAAAYTGVVGYQEVLTHPSYRGSLLVLTYPIAGAYGVNGEDDESPAVQAAGLVVREASRTFSNFRAERSLEDRMTEAGLVGIREVDTRAVAVHLREAGEMAAAIVPGDADTDAVVQRLQKADTETSRDLIADVTWAGRREPDGKAACTLALVNLGVAESLLAQLVDLGCAVEVLPADVSADDVLAAGAEGAVLAGGPGDPRGLAAQIETAKALLGEVPVLGIGLGHQVLALAAGCEVEAMRAGHRGLNYPVRDHTGGRGAITVQHHRYVVSRDALGKGVEVTHTNFNDETVEGIRAADGRASGIQWHPTRDDMGRPSPLLRAFCEGLKA
ncbi:MAG: glutamine-hydrolyzing carbamoyl-phosphate synthase small subunit [Phycisphaerae bacterium]